MSEKTRVFVGNVKARTNQYGTSYTLGFKLDDLKKLEAHIKSSGWVNVNLSTNKEGKPFMNIDDWEPTKKATVIETDLPF